MNAPLTVDEVDATHSPNRFREALVHAMGHGWIEVFATDQPDEFIYTLTEEGRKAAGAPA